MADGKSTSFTSGVGLPSFAPDVSLRDCPTFLGEIVHNNFKGVVPVDANEPVVVQTTNNFAEAEILKNVLESEGIKCELGGENQGSFADVLGIPIMVRAGDEERARQVLAAHSPHHGHHG